MPQQLTYPGVYIEEVPNPVRAIVGVATSRTAFVGFAPRGPADDPTLVRNFGEYQRIFGGLDHKSRMSYAVDQYFQNGGGEALIVRRVEDAPKVASAKGLLGQANLKLEARSPGVWGDHLSFAEEYVTTDAADKDPLFNLHVMETETPGEKDPAKALAREVLLNLSGKPESPRYAPKVIEEQSRLVRVAGAASMVKSLQAIAVPHGKPPKPAQPAAGLAPLAYKAFSGGGDSDPETVSLLGDAGKRTGLYALEKADIFNLLCLPAPSVKKDVAQADWDAASKFCEDRRAILIIDPPEAWRDHNDVLAGLRAAQAPFKRSKNAAVYFPRLRMADRLRESQPEEFPPCGVVAGVIARTDAARGIWKAPAGQEAGLSGVRELACRLTDGDQGELNRVGVNCFRSFPEMGTVLWGARTTMGADQLADQWKYLPVRRTALYIEESLYRGTQWVVFEPNDEPLWAQVRMNVGSFMQGLYRQGAFQGGSAKEAYFVKCDAETTTQDDIDRGIVNILVGFAPLKPAEFVVIKISQLTHRETT